MTLFGNLSLRRGGALAYTAVLFLMGTAVWGQRMDRGTAARLLRRPHAAAEFIVQFREPEAAPDSEDLGRFAAGGVRGMERLGAGRFHLVRAGRGGQEVLAGLSEHPEIVTIEPNYVIQVEKTPVDAMFGQQWGLKNANNADIAATAAWDYTTGGRKTVVAVIDTGVDYTHPDLAANIWSAPRPFTFAGANGTVTCPVGSRGVNAIESTCVPMDDNGHGTHCAGIIGAMGNNTAGVAGVNWEASILPVRFLNKQGSGTLADALRAIDSVIQIKKQLGAEANIRVISASWGFGALSPALETAIGAANAAEILFVAAAGNDGRSNDTTASYPANSAQPNVVSVAATDRNDALATFSNYGQKVQLGAPGVEILSTYPGAKYANMSGTSMATPYVAGAAALLLSTCTANTATVRQHLLASVDAVAALNGKTATGGRLNVYKAIRRCATPSATLTATPAAVTVRAGDTASYSLLAGGLTGTATLAITGAPAGVTVSGAGGVTFGTAVTVRATTTRTVAAGTYTLTATLTAGNLRVTAPLSLKVEALPPFTFTVRGPAAPVAPGASGAATVTIVRNAGFTGAVTVTPQGLPAGVTASAITLASAQTTASLPLQIGPAVAAGTLNVTLTAAGGGVSVPGTVVVTVPRVLKLGFGATQYSVKAGGTATLAVTLSSNAAVTAALKFTLSGLPGATTLSLTAGPAGTYQLKIATPATWAGKSAALKLAVTDGALSAEATTKLAVTN